MSRDTWEVGDLPPRYRAQAEAQLAEGQKRKQARRARVKIELRTSPAEPRKVQTEPIVLDLPVKPWSLNVERALHWRKHGQLTAAVRAFVAVQVARLDVGQYAGRVEIVATPRGVKHDAGNSYPTVKAAVDALVDVGVLADDDPAHVARVVMNAPVAGEAGLILLVRLV